MKVGFYLASRSELDTNYFLKKNATQVNPRRWSLPKWEKELESGQIMGLEGPFLKRNKHIYRAVIFIKFSNKNESSSFHEAQLK